MLRRKKRQKFLTFDFLLDLAQALRKFCFKCESGLLPVLKIVFEQYTSIFPKIKVEDRSLIVEGFVHLIYKLPADQVTGALQMIISPILANIQQINSQPAVSLFIQRKSYTRSDHVLTNNFYTLLVN